MKIRQKGFTIVELLIVVVIIGILAAIVIVAYNGITGTAHDSTIKNDLSSISKKLEIYKTEEGQYPVTAAELDAADFKVAKSSYETLDSSGNPRNNLYYRADNQGRWYALGVISESGQRYYLKNGQISETGSTSWDNAGTQVINMAAAEGVTLTTANLGGSSGLSGSTGWEDWTE